MALLINAILKRNIISKVYANNTYEPYQKN